MHHLNFCSTVDKTATGMLEKFCKIPSVQTLHIHKVALNPASNIKCAGVRLLISKVHCFIKSLQSVQISCKENLIALKSVYLCYTLDLPKTSYQ